MNTQMKYIFPFLVAFIAYKYLGVVALYLIASNIFTIGQQIYVNKTEKKVLEVDARVVKKFVKFDKYMSKEENTKFNKRIDRKQR